MNKRICQLSDNRMLKFTTNENKRQLSDITYTIPKTIKKQRFNNSFPNKISDCTKCNCKSFHFGNLNFNVNCNNIFFYSQTSLSDRKFENSYSLDRDLTSSDNNSISSDTDSTSSNNNSSSSDTDSTSSDNDSSSSDTDSTSSDNNSTFSDNNSLFSDNNSTTSDNNSTSSDSDSISSDENETEINLEKPKTDFTKSVLEKYTNKECVESTLTPSKIEEKNRFNEDDLKCKICLDQQREILFQECGHFMCCKSCSNKINKCPICRKSIKNKIRTYLS